MLRSYRLYLYKLFTIPNMEGVRSSVSSIFGIMIILQMTNMASIYFLMKYFFSRIDFSDYSKFSLFLLFTFPSIVFNYYTIYHKSGYKKILKEFGKEKRGSLKHLVIYFLISISFFLMSAMLVVEE